MSTGTVAILNVSTGDTKLSFDKNNPAERIRAARIVTDMIRRGYALLVEVERNGVKGYQRVERFDEEACEYIIADFDPLAAQQADQEESEASNEEQAQTAEQAAPAAAPIRRGRPPKKAIPAESAKAVAVPRRAGG